MSSEQINRTEKKKNTESIIAKLNQLNDQLELFLARPALYGIEGTEQLESFRGGVQEILKRYDGPEMRNLVFEPTMRALMLTMAVAIVGLLYEFNSREDARLVGMGVIICVLLTHFFMVFRADQHYKTKYDQRYEQLMHDGIAAQQLIEEIESFISTAQNIGGSVSELEEEGDRRYLRIKK